MAENIEVLTPTYTADLNRLQGSLGKRLFRLSLPMILNQGSVIFMMFCDRIFLSWYGVNEISAVWPAAFLAWSTYTFFYSISSFVNIFVAHYFGAGNKRMCSVIVWQGIYYALGAYVILLCLIPFGRSAFALFGHRPEIAVLERTFYTVIMCASLMPILNNITAAFFTGRSLSYITMLSNIIGNVVNIGLDWVLIFGHFGAPRLGILGAALATAIASTIPPIIMFAIFLSRRYQAEYATRQAWRFKWKPIRQLIRTGAPCGFQDMSYLLSVSLFFMLMGRTLPEALAANNIAWSINDLLTLYCFGLPAAGMTLLAQSIGMNRFEEAEKAIYLVVKVMFGLAAVIACSYLFFSTDLLALFRPRISGAEPQVPFEQIVPRGRIVLRYLSAYNFCILFVYIFRQALRGAGETRIFLKTAPVLDLCILMGGLFLVDRLFGSNVFALWNYFIFCLALEGAFYFYWFRRGSWKTADRTHLNEQH